MLEDIPSILNQQKFSFLKERTPWGKNMVDVLFFQVAELTDPCVGWEEMLDKGANPIPPAQHAQLDDHLVDVIKVGCCGDKRMWTRKRHELCV